MATEMKVAFNVDDLRTIDGTGLDGAYLLWRDVEGDNGGSSKPLYWDADSTETDDGIFVIQATGITTGRWKRQTEDLYPEFWGAKGDNVADDQPAIQAMINYALNKRIRKVFLRDCKYRIADSIFLGTHDMYNGLSLIGTGIKHRNVSTFGGSVIVADFSDRMAIDVQGARNTSIQNLTIYGKLYDHIFINKLGTINAKDCMDQVIDDTDHTKWNNPALASSQDSQFAPYAAITIDAYTGDRPEGYSYPGTYHGLVNSKASSEVHIEDVDILGFNTGIVIQPSDIAANGDFTRIVRTRIAYSKYAISTGNSESRNVECNSLNVSFCYCFLTGDKHGAQKGRYGGVINNCSLGNVINVFELEETSQTGNILFNALYGENLYRIGYVNNNTGTENAIVFQSCQLRFDLQDKAGITAKGIPAQTLQTSTSFPVAVVFNGCTLSGYNTVVGIIAPNIKLIKTLLIPEVNKGALAIADKYVRLGINTLAGGLITRSLDTPGYQNIKHLRRDIDSPTTVDNIELTEDYRAFRNKGVPIYARNILYTSGNAREDSSLRRPNNYRAVQKTSLGSPNVTGDILTFNLSKPEWERAMFGFSEGDVIVDENTYTTFFITSNDGTTITAKAQTNIKYGCSGYGLIEPLNFSAGYLYFYTCRLYLSDVPVTANFASDSPVGTNAGGMDGFYAPSLNSVTVGDYVYVNKWEDNLISETRSKITGINTTTEEITLNGNANYSKSMHRIKTLMRVG